MAKGAQQPEQVKDPKLKKVQAELNRLLEKHGCGFEVSTHITGNRIWHEINLVWR